MLILAVSIGALIVFAIFWVGFRLSHKGLGHFFFDPQDAFAINSESRSFPKSAQSGTFEPMLKHYIGVVQLFVTVAAASVAFGGNSQSIGLPLAAAKLILAWSIFYGVLFCAFLLWRYDEYSQNVKSYTLRWYSIIFAMGFASLTCFIFGYLAWGWGLFSLVAK